jgi:hypothetical protein
MSDRVEAVDGHVTRSVHRAVTDDYRRGYQSTRGKRIESRESLHGIQEPSSACFIDVLPAELAQSGNALDPLLQRPLGL